MWFSCRSSVKVKAMSDSAGSVTLSMLLSRWQDEHPYLFASCISALFIIWLTFFAPFGRSSESEFSVPEAIEFINIDTMESAKRVTRQDVSSESESVSENAEVKRAVGTSADSAVDLSFYPNIAPPRPIGRLKKRYPRSAMDLNVEAVVNVELLISSDGRVQNVRIIGIRLSKSIPPEVSSRLMNDFSEDAKKILTGARFTPPVVEGRNIPIKMEMPLRFRIE